MTTDATIRPRVPVDRSSPHERWARNAMTSAELAEATRRLIEELKAQREELSR